MYLIPLILFSYALAAEISLPHWFLSPSSYPGYITGYGEGGLSPVEDAASRHCFYNKTILSGEYYRYNDYDEKISDYYWDISPVCISEIKDELIEVSSFRSNVLSSSKVSLYGYSRSSHFISQNVNIDTIDFIHDSYINIDTNHTPLWLDEIFWNEEGYYYSVGEYTSRAENNDAWKTAEERAFFNLLTAVSVEVSSVSILKITESSDYSISEEYEEIIRYRYFHRMVNAQVIERWPDLYNDLYYVLVRVHKDDIKIKNSEG